MRRATLAIGLIILVGAVPAGARASAAGARVAVTRVSLSDVPGPSDGRSAIAGLLPPLEASGTIAGKKRMCREPECDVSYHGGPVQTGPRVYLLYWGTKWNQRGYDAAFSYLFEFFEGLGGGWSADMTQYRNKAAKHPSFGKSQLRGVYLDYAAPPKRVGAAQLSAVVNQLAKKERLSGSDDQVIVAAQQGTCFSDGFAGSCGKANPKGSYCAYHSSSHGLPYVNLPYQPDAGRLCGENLVNKGARGRYDGFSISGGHEYAETVTDPLPDSGWIDTRDKVSGGEIADKCVLGGAPFGVRDPLGDVRLSTGSFAMQSLWSNKAGRCVI
jgi:hypothetical protein